MIGLSFNHKTAKSWTGKKKLRRGGVAASIPD
jgi:hypothetical protein